MYPGASNNTELVPDTLLHRTSRCTADGLLPNDAERCHRRVAGRPTGGRTTTRWPAELHTAAATTMATRLLFDGHSIQLRTALVVRRPNCPTLNLGTARRQQSCAPAHDATASCCRCWPRHQALQPCHRRPFQGRLHHPPLRPARHKRCACGADGNVPAHCYMDEALDPRQAYDPALAAQVQPAPLIERPAGCDMITWRPA